MPSLHTRGEAKLAVDIGGTFTDVALQVAEGRYSSKVLTTPSSPEDGVMAGIDAVLKKAGLPPQAVELLIHGTTLATNAIIERKGARTALITTEGFRDVIEIGYESRYNQYDINVEKAVPLVPRFRRHTVAERMNLKGEVLVPLDESAVRRLVETFQEEEVEALAIGYLHSYANASHERRTAEIIKERLPDLSITLSSEVCPEVREYERLTTATANAYVQPLMAGYLSELERRLVEAGISAPLLLMTSGGGVTDLENAMRFPVRLVESGPAGGAILAQHIARDGALDKVISFDMGGTTAKICLIEDLEPKRNREFEVDRQARFMKGSGLPLRIPVIEMVEIGAGGGSIARIDQLKRITVGPDSAGADPGPAAYGRGGIHPTITDANVVLGKIDPGSFAGGKVSLDLNLAEQAVAEDIAKPLSLATSMAAVGILEIVEETMANAARVHAVEQGKAVEEHALIAFGGAAPLHVCRMAEKLGIERIIVPVNAGIGSAVGFLLAPVAYDLVRSRHMRLAQFDAGLANDILEEMREEARKVVDAAAKGDEQIAETRAYMRYVGQGHEVVVKLPTRTLVPEDRQVFESAFEEEYRRLYNRILPNAEVEILTWGFSLSTVAAENGVRQTAPSVAGQAESDAQLEIFDIAAGRTEAVPLYRRSELAGGAHLTGPAVIVEDETSTFISKSFDAEIMANGNILLERKPHV